MRVLEKYYRKWIIGSNPHELAWFTWAKRIFEVITRCKFKWREKRSLLCSMETHLKAKHYRRLAGLFYLFMTSSTFIHYKSFLLLTPSHSMHTHEDFQLFYSLLNGYGLEVSHDPGYASPDGAVTSLVKFAPASKTFNHSVDYCCSEVYLEPFAIFLKQFKSCSFKLKEVNKFVWKKVHEQPQLLQPSTNP